jgi:hypothetical protein
MGGWQDWLVTAIAAWAGLVVLSRTLGSWKDSKPEGASPHCDGCAVSDAAKTPPPKQPTKVRGSAGP